jgi:hypothetical protein
MSLVAGRWIQKFAGFAERNYFDRAMKYVQCLQERGRLKHLRGALPRYVSS